MTADWLVHRGLFEATSTGTTVDYVVATPPDFDRGEHLPLLQVLHAAGSSGELLTRQLKDYSALLHSGRLPRVVIACASTPTSHGSYIDQPAGPAWERLVAEEFPRHVRAEFGATNRTGLLGASMGGYGALKIAFRSPARYAAVAAVSPAVFPSSSRATIGARNTMGVLGDLRDTMAGHRDDDVLFAHNDVATVLARNVDAIRASELRILLDCGDADVFALQDGSEYLHRRLWDLDVAHDYHLVLDADHIGPAAPARLRNALVFAASSLGDTSTSALPAEHTAAALAAMREAVRPLREQAASLDASVSRRYGRLSQ